MLAEIDSKGMRLSPSRRQVMRLLGLAAWSNVRQLGAENSPLGLQKRRFSVPLVDDDGNVVSHYNASSLYFVQKLGKVPLEMALIPGGNFIMGSPFNVPVLPSKITEQPLHEVSIKPFALGVYPVTIEQWRQVSSFPKVNIDLRRVLPSGLPPEIEGKLPIDFVSYAECEEFCRRLQAHTGRAYRFPSEAEWEYACRAGTSTNYHFGDGISLQVANYNNGIYRPLALTPVGSKQTPNRFGLHDMHGNVLEWW